MAFCTECGAEMDATAVRCDGCGYEFPDITDVEVVRERLAVGWAYSPAADLLLLIVQVLLGITLVITLIGICGTALTAVFYPSWNNAMACLGMMFASALTAANLIVFVRVGNL